MWIGVCCVLDPVYCLSVVVLCLLFVGCRLLFDFNCSLLVVRVVCSLLPIACWLSVAL